MKLWVVQENISEDVFDFVGVFNTEERAVAACYNEFCAVAPTTLNEGFGEERIEWEGWYYPSEK
jgi:hypothetical protein